MNLHCRSHRHSIARLCLVLIAALALGLADTARADKPAEPEAKPIRVAMFNQGGAKKELRVREFTAALPPEQGFEFVVLEPDQIRVETLKKFDVLLMPGGSAGRQSNLLGAEGRDAIRRYVADGGGYVGVCAGAYLASSQYTWGLDLMNAFVVDREHWARGMGTVTISLNEVGRQTLGQSTERCEVFYGQGPLLAPAEKPGLPAYEPLSLYETEIAKKGAPSGVMIGTTAIARAPYHRGRVMCFSPHPEKTEGMGHLITNGVRWAAGIEPTPVPAADEADEPGSAETPAAADASTEAEAAR